MTGSTMVTGGTGLLGRLVVRRLQRIGGQAYEHLVVLSRSRRDDTSGVRHVVGDLSRSDAVPDVADALHGVTTLVHLAGSDKGDEVKTRHLVDAVRHAGTRPHVIYMSVVGADRTPVVSGIDRMIFGYMASKAASERIVEESGLPWTTLRSTQFHEFVGQFAAAQRGSPIVMVPGATRMQTIDADEVAARLVELAEAEPAGLVAEMGGPEAIPAVRLMRDYLNVVGRRALVVAPKLPGHAAAAYRNGSNLTLNHATGERTWERYLAQLRAGVDQPGHEGRRAAVDG